MERVAGTGVAGREGFVFAIETLELVRGGVRVGVCVSRVVGFAMRLDEADASAGVVRVIAGGWPTVPARALGAGGVVCVGLIDGFVR